MRNGFVHEMSSSLHTDMTFAEVAPHG